jgi:hypothetical protein
LGGILLAGEIPGQIEFEHLLSHTFPGFFLAITLFMLIDVWSPSPLTVLVLSNSNIMIAFIGFVLLIGTILGVILDNIHHCILEGLIFDQFDEVQLWITKFNDLTKIDPNKANHCDAENIAYYFFVKKLGPDALGYITHLRKGKYCYSEFYANTFIATVPFFIVVPFYILKTFQISWNLCILISIIVWIISCISLISSYQAYLNYNKSLYYLVLGFMKEDPAKRHCNVRIRF